MQGRQWPLEMCLFSYTPIPCCRETPFQLSSKHSPIKMWSVAHSVFVSIVINLLIDSSRLPPTCVRAFAGFYRRPGVFCARLQLQSHRWFSQCRLDGGPGDYPAFAQNRQDCAASTIRHYLRPAASKSRPAAQCVLHVVYAHALQIRRFARTLAAQVPGCAMRLSMISPTLLDCLFFCHQGLI